MSTREWSGLTLEARTEYGRAAHGNRGHYSGEKVHELATEYIVAVADGHTVYPGSMSAEFLRTGKPVLFSSRPLCATTQGQHAGRPMAGKGAADVTCERCQTKIARRAAYLAQQEGK